MIRLEFSIKHPQAVTWGNLNSDFFGQLSLEFFETCSIIRQACCVMQHYVVESVCSLLAHRKTYPFQKKRRPHFWHTSRILNLFFLGLNFLQLTLNFLGNTALLGMHVLWCSLIYSGERLLTFWRTEKHILSKIKDGHIFGAQVTF
jgi:hypothetical protein